MSNYAKGIRVERAVVNELKGDGYAVSRAASSKGGLGDVIAVKEGQVLFVNVKYDEPPGPDERARLIRVAGYLPGVGVPLVALGPASRITYRLLTGPGPADWVPWTPDEVAA